MTSVNYKKEFGLQISKHLDHYGLTKEDFAQLIRSNSTYVQKIIDGDVSLTFDKIIEIAALFGISYYVFGDISKEPVSSFEHLPEQTKQKINERANKGIVERNSDNLLANELNRLIAEGKLNTPTTAQILQLSMDSRIAKRSATEITSLLNKPPRNKYIAKLKKVGKQIVFVHKDFAAQYADTSVADLRHILTTAKETALHKGRKN